MFAEYTGKPDRLNRKSAAETEQKDQKMNCARYSSMSKSFHTFIRPLAEWLFAEDWEKYMLIIGFMQVQKHFSMLLTDQIPAWNCQRVIPFTEKFGLLKVDIFFIDLPFQSNDS